MHCLERDLCVCLVHGGKGLHLSSVLFEERGVHDPIQVKFQVAKLSTMLSTLERRSNMVSIKVTNIPALS